MSVICKDCEHIDCRIFMPAYVKCRANPELMKNFVEGHLHVKEYCNVKNKSGECMDFTPRRPRFVSLRRWLGW